MLIYGMFVLKPVKCKLVSNYVNYAYLGLFAIRADREYVVMEDFMKAVRKVADAKKLETKLDYKPI